MLDRDLLKGPRADQHQGAGGPTQEVLAGGSMQQPVG